MSSCSIPFDRPAQLLISSFDIYSRRPCSSCRTLSIILHQLPSIATNPSKKPKKPKNQKYTPYLKNHQSKSGYQSINLRYQSIYQNIQNIQIFIGAVYAAQPHQSNSLFPIPNLQRKGETNPLRALSHLLPFLFFFFFPFFFFFFFFLLFLLLCFVNNYLTSYYRLIHSPSDYIFDKSFRPGQSVQTTSLVIHQLSYQTCIRNRKKKEKTGLLFAFHSIPKRLASSYIRA